VEADLDGARELVRAVGSLPLALTLAGGYLAAPQHGMFSSMFPNLRRDAMDRLHEAETRLGLAQPRLEAPGGQPVSLGETTRWSLRRLPPAALDVFKALAVVRPLTAGLFPRNNPTGEHRPLECELAVVPFLTVLPFLARKRKSLARRNKTRMGCFR
jgi:hypothetical protein